MTPLGAAFRARLLDNQEGASSASIERHVFGKLSAIYFARRSFRHGQTLFQLWKYRAWKIGREACDTRYTPSFTVYDTCKGCVWWGMYLGVLDNLPGYNLPTGMFTKYYHPPSTIPVVLLPNMISWTLYPGRKYSR